MIGINRKDKRYFLDRDNPYNVSIQIGSFRQQKGQIRDISHNGMCIAVNIETFLQKQKQYTFKIYGTNDNVILETTGEIIWNINNEKGKQRLMYYGVEFQNPIQIPYNIRSYHYVTN
ncbi:MAG: PilZ domain-containing protein [Spirochaetota bacterium]